MAIVSTTPYTYSRLRPTRVRPMRGVRLLKCDPMDRWLATADIMLDSDLSLPLPEGEVMCALIMCILKLSFGTVYRLSMVVYDREAGCSVALNLGRYQGLHTDAEAPLWTRRLPPREFLRFSQPRFKLLALLWIPLFTGGQHKQAPSAKALSWARDASVGTSTHRLIARRCKNIALRKIKVWARGTNLRGL
ncbi:hypothetical protein B0H13DRAFT_2364675 [Mycena leptocephala]|nr:hypothetical protein B0H13DRAFT_2364675 [Mycena leptocephala]